MYTLGMDVPVTELRAHLSDWLDRVRAGEEIVVTDRSSSMSNPSMRRRAGSLIASNTSCSRFAGVAMKNNIRKIMLTCQDDRQCLNYSRTNRLVPQRLPTPAVWNALL